MQGHYVRGSWRHGSGDRCPVYFIPDVKSFFFAGGHAGELMHFCPPGYHSLRATKTFDTCEPIFATPNLSEALSPLRLS